MDIEKLGKLGIRRTGSSLSLPAHGGSVPIYREIYPTRQGRHALPFTADQGRSDLPADQSRYIGLPARQGRRGLPIV
jgi:hypothetical protein